ncbi:MAG: hypothetical protein IPK67_00225 [Planctomycetes bacterium]|nr:hypothetical protein [Planctomycetota bacterium]
MLQAEPHPLLVFRALWCDFPAPLSELPSPDWLTAALSPTGPAPVSSSDELRAAVRDMLRQGGYKPTGRGKPASEYLRKAAAEGGIPSINAAVDTCNAVSLHSGFPISVVDLDRAHGPHRIAVSRGATPYVFNASGQTIDVEGLLCLFDAVGPCANAVKDSQRTKTHGETRRTLSVVWGARGHEAGLERALEWYAALAGRLGAGTRQG